MPDARDDARRRGYRESGRRGPGSRANRIWQAPRRRARRPGRHNPGVEAPLRKEPGPGAERYRTSGCEHEAGPEGQGGQGWGRRRRRDRGGPWLSTSGTGCYRGEMPGPCPLVESSVVSPLLLIASGAVIGALVAPGERWQPVPMERARVGFAPSRGRGVRFSIASRSDLEGGPNASRLHRRWPLGFRGRGTRGRPPALHCEIALAHPHLGVGPARHLEGDRAPASVGVPLGSVGEEVVVLELLGDRLEDPDEVAHLVGEEEGTPRLLGDLLHEAAGAAPEKAGLALEGDAVDGRFHGPRVVDHLALRGRARVVVAVGEHHHRLPPRL